MLTKRFWVATFERATRTAAQSLAAVLVASGADLLHCDWETSLSVAGMATLLSVLTSITAGALDPATGPSFGPETPVQDTSGPGVPPQAGSLSARVFDRSKDQPYPTQNEK